LHCNACGAVQSDRGVRCSKCGVVSNIWWILGLALALWFVSLMAYFAGRFFAYADFERLYSGLGSAPPLPSRVYFALSDFLGVPVAAVALIAPAVLFLTSRSAPRRLWMWTRRYAITAIVSATWILLGAAAVYLAMSALARSLS
jgi:hypothetical protein